MERGGNLCCLFPAKEGDHRHFQPSMPTLTGCSQEVSVSKGHLWLCAGGDTADESSLFQLEPSTVS